MSSVPISSFTLRLDSRIWDAVVCIDRSAHVSIALILDDDGRLINTVTDGDIRRGVLSGLSLDEPVSKLLPVKLRTPHAEALTAPVGMPRASLAQLMRDNGVRQVPLVDADRRVVDVVVLTDVLAQTTLPLEAVVMAGGMGQRLRPLTDGMPKPMLAVGGRPLLELIVGQLRTAGIRKIHISTNYRAEMIENHFRDGSGFDVEVSYLREEQPLGTAGALALIPSPALPLLVINGDILTHTDFGAMYAFHKEHSAALTVGVRKYEFQIPYGVIESQGARVRAVNEKPLMGYMISAGMYIVEPAALATIPRGQYCDMTDLIQRQIEQRSVVVSFSILDYWLDIGRPADYERAQDDASSGRYRAAEPASVRESNAKK